MLVPDQIQTPPARAGAMIEDANAASSLTVHVCHVPVPGSNRV